MPPLFRFIQEEGRVDREEMYRVFNMGIGMIVFVREQNAVEADGSVLKGAARRSGGHRRVEKGRDAA